jgi:hypothetical protein
MGEYVFEPVFNVVHQLPLAGAYTATDCFLGSVGGGVPYRPTCPPASVASSGLAGAARQRQLTNFSVG